MAAQVYSFQPIKCKLLLSIYSQLCVVQYGEFGRWSLVRVKVCQSTNSPNTVHIFCSEQVGRIKVGIFGVSLRWMSYGSHWTVIDGRPSQAKESVLLLYRVVHTKDPYNNEQLKRIIIITIIITDIFITTKLLSMWALYTNYINEKKKKSIQCKLANFSSLLNKSLSVLLGAVVRKEGVILRGQWLS